MSSNENKFPGSPDRDRVLRINRTAYDRMTVQGAPLCQRVGDDELREPLFTVDAPGWLGGNIFGWKTLCLAAGGGRQSSLYAAAGADVTVVDLSPAMLDQDRSAARQRGHKVRLIETSMDDLSMLGDGEFDLVVHPVSTCYLPDVSLVFRQVARVTRVGGLYISQHKSPTSLQCSMQKSSRGYAVEHRYQPGVPVPSPPVRDPVAARLREPGAMEFLHRWQDLIGGMCRSGFVIEDLIEPDHTIDRGLDDARAKQADAFAERARYIAPYVRIKARRVAAKETLAKRPIWLPP